MFLRLLKDSFFRNRRRKILAIMTIAIAATLTSVLVHISVDIGNKMAKELGSYESNIRILPQSEVVSLSFGGVDYNPLKGRTFLNEKDLPRIKGIFWSNNIAGFAPFLTMPVIIIGNEMDPVLLVGTYFQREIKLNGAAPFKTGLQSMRPYWAIQGQWPDDSHPNEVLMGQHLAEKMHLNVEDSFQVTKGNRYRVSEMLPANLHITGILSGDETYDNAIIAPIQSVQNLSGLPNAVESVDVAAMTVPENTLSRKALLNSDNLDIQEYDLWYCTAYVSSIAHQIEEAIPNASVKPIWHVAETKGAVIDKIQLLMGVMTLVIFIAAGLGVGIIIQTGILERSAEIALMKALGAATHHVTLLFAAEAILLGIIGGICGYFLGMGLSQIIGWDLFKTTISPTPVVGPIVLTYAILIAMTGMISGLARIQRICPAMALHGRM